jgi:23S rRNA (cytidine1920-2'-O)/16S rRNA (cytidine1409-2'-O)-methyltransferase
MARRAMPERVETDRADLALVKRGLFESRAKARAAIEAGLVTADGEVVRKPSGTIPAGAVVEARAAHPWVSRGGVKLAAALEAFGIDPAGRDCLDIGSSTGGFTQVLLEGGAARVTAVDVGTGQMHASLRGDPRLALHETIDARALTPEMLGEPPSLIVIDVSFIPLGLVLPHVLGLAGEPADLVALVKPQFEVGRKHAPKGIVRDASARTAACESVRRTIEGLGWTVTGLIESPIHGGDGNIEYLIGARLG